MLTSGSLDGTVSQWNLNLPARRDQAGRQAGRNLTLAEEAQYYGSAPQNTTCDQWPAGN